MIERAVDLALLAILPRRVPFLLGPEALFIDQQQCRIEHAIGQPPSVSVLMRSTPPAGNRKGPGAKVLT